MGGVKDFEYPAPGNQCLLIRPSENEYVAYSQKCSRWDMGEAAELLQNLSKPPMPRRVESVRALCESPAVRWTQQWHPDMSVRRIGDEQNRLAIAE